MSIIAPTSKQLVSAQLCMCFRRLKISTLQFICDYQVSYSRCTEFRHTWQSNSIIFTVQCWMDMKFAWKVLDKSGLWIFPTKKKKLKAKKVYETLVFGRHLTRLIAVNILVHFSVVTTCTLHVLTRCTVRFRDSTVFVRPSIIDCSSFCFSLLLFRTFPFAVNSFFKWLLNASDSLSFLEIARDLFICFVRRSWMCKQQRASCNVLSHSHTHTLIKRHTHKHK